jgi:hypothetical protein
MSTKKEIDCLIIGHFQIETNQLNIQLRKGGRHSGSYRDFSMGIISYRNNHYSFTELYNTVVEKNGMTQFKIENKDTFNAAISYIGSYLHRNNISFDYITSVNDEIQKMELILKSIQIQVLLFFFRKILMS